MIKKLFSILLVFVMVLAMIPTGVIQVTASQSGDYTYTVTSTTTAMITAYTGSASLVPIPSYFGSYKVTAIGDNVFYNRSAITNVSIPNSVTSIGKSAFQGCVKLYGISIPNTVTYVGAYAFAGTSWLSTFPQDFIIVGDSILIGYKGSLTGISIPAGVKSIQGSAFSGNIKLISIVVPGSVTNIGPYSFYNCTANLTLPTGISTIGTYAFSGYKGQTTININTPGASIGDYAFSGCRNLAKININAPGASIGAYTFSNTSAIITVTGDLSHVGNYAFSSCKGLKDITVNGNGSTIGTNAFSYCSGLLSVNLTGNITGIGNNAFYDILSLTVVSITGNIQNIGDYVFANCPKLTGINVDESCASYSSKDGVLFNKDKTSLIQCPGGKTGYYKTPESVTGFAVGAFMSCAKLTGIEIPNSIKCINDYLFAGCEKLSNFAIPSGVAWLGTSSFNGCKELTNLTIPVGVNSIGDYAFSECLKLDKIIIPAGITEVHNGTFSGCIGLTTVDLPSSVTSIGDSAFSGCSSLSAVSIPDSVTTIGWYAFFDCKLITKANLGPNLTQIGREAFANCTALHTINIPDNIFAVGIEAFSGCEGLISINIGSRVENIDGSTFYGCKELSEITVNENSYSYICEDGVLFNKSKTNLILSIKTLSGEYEIPASVTQIGQSAFYNCKGLTHVILPTGLTEIGYGAFEGCSGLTSIELPTGLKKLNSDTFSGCTGIAKMIIPDSLTEIDINTFEGCTGLTEVSIGKGVTTIGGGAFSGCSGLVQVYIPGKVKSLPPGAFSGCSSLVQIEVDETNAAYLSIDGVLFNKAGTKLICFPAGKSGSYAIPESVTVIDSNAFLYCDKITRITIPSKLTSITYNILYCCASLNQINVSADNTAYSSENGVLFNKAKTALIRYPVAKTGAYVIPGSVIIIESSAFSDNKRLTSIFIPAKVTKINDFFNNCTDLSQINVDASNKSFSSKDGILFNKAKTILIKYPANRKGNYSVPGTITEIGGYAFSYCAGMTSVIIPNSVVKIGGFAFFSCIGLTGVAISSSVVNIGDFSFSSCTGLTKVTIPASVTNLGYSAFKDCSNLTAAYFPGNSPIKEYSVFDGCSPSFTLYYNSEKTGFDEFWNVYHSETYVAKVTSVKLNATVLTWAVGKSGTFKVTVSPIEATNLDVSWKSSNKNVAIIDNNGKLTAINIGTAIITCTATDGSGESSTCKITVCKAVSSIVLNTVNLKWAVGKRDTLSAVILPSDALIKAVSWSSSNSAVAVISGTGIVKAVGIGTAVITCTAKDGSGKKATCNITVGKPAISIALNTRSVNMIVGNGKILTASISPTDSIDKTVSWSSSNTSIATIDSTGKIKAVGAGTATITCTAKDGSGIKATCTVTVTPMSPNCISAIKSSNTSIKLSWTKISGVTGYEVYRSATQTGKYTKIASVTDTMFTNTGLSTGKTYYYKLKSFKIYGELTYKSLSSSIVYVKL